jgi:hypothetical protein
VKWKESTIFEDVCKIQGRQYLKRITNLLFGFAEDAFGKWVALRREVFVEGDDPVVAINDLELDVEEFVEFLGVPAGTPKCYNLTL